MTQLERQLLEQTTGSVHSQESFGTVDGPGIRYVFFLQGCPLRCVYCHNPDSISTKGGEQWTAKQVLDQIKRYKRYIKTGGVTLSGGEPLMQVEFATAIIKLLNEEKIHVAIDTSGIMPLHRIKESINHSDLISLDIKALDTEVCKRISGSGNENALALLDYCQKINKPVWIRHVLLKGYTLDESALHSLAEFLVPYTCIERVELLPFHKMGEAKWRQLDMEYQLWDTPAVIKEEAGWAKVILRNYGLNVQ